MTEQMTVSDGGANNSLVGAPTLSTSARVVFRGNNSRVVIGKNVHLVNVNVYLHNDAYVEFGDDSLIRGSFVAHHGCRIVLGPKTRCNSYLNVSTAERTSMLMGSDCLIAQATIRTSDMHPVFEVATGTRLNPAKDVTIGDHVWLGQDVYVGKGCVIGANSVLGAYAVVVKSVPENCAVGGNPAKVLREGISWDKRLPIGR